jgi:hypothetical protein
MSFLGAVSGAGRLHPAFGFDWVGFVWGGCMHKSNRRQAVSVSVSSGGSLIEQSPSQYSTVAPDLFATRDVIDFARGRPNIWTA